MTDQSPFTGATTIAAINLVLRFLLELAMIAALFTWGVRIADPIWLKTLLGVAAPALALFAWGAFIAPRASRRLADPARLLLEIVLFGLAAIGLATVGLPVWAIALAAVAALNIAILQALKLR